MSATSARASRPPMIPAIPAISEKTAAAVNNRRGETIDGGVEWTIAMKRAIRSQAELRARLGLPPEQLPASAESFPTFVPLELLSRIRPNDPGDPILRQVLATESEVKDDPGFVSDPVGDLDADLGGGLLKKYPGRALIVTHGACAVHCRYCFRREFPYAENASIKLGWKSALDRIAADKSIQEVLLSGGDPLTLADGTLFKLIENIEAIPHVRRLRIHSRLPIVIPQRVTTALVDRLAESRLATWFVVHANHANEIDEPVTEALARLTNHGISVLNQSVLLAGVNDDVETLAELSETLIDRQVQPYYLHQLDRVRGAGHFWVDPDEGNRMIEALRARLPGYAVPQYVVEIAGRSSKTPVS